MYPCMQVYVYTITRFSQLKLPGQGKDGGRIPRPFHYGLLRLFVLPRLKLGNLRHESGDSVVLRFDSIGGTIALCRLSLRLCRREIDGICHGVDRGGK